MKYWFDTEYIDRPRALELISIGIVAEDDREFYAESSEVDWSLATQWTLQNVRPQLEGDAMSLEMISYGIRRLTEHDEHPVFWGYFPAYDWVLFSRLFGGLADLPFHFPHLCMDIKQWAIELGDPELPHQAVGRHNALQDARWTREAWRFLGGLHPPGANRRAHGRKHPIPSRRPSPAAALRP